MRGLGIVLVAVVQLPSSAQLPVPKPAYTAFQRAERVTIANHSGDAMEPFLTRDGRFLLFNSRNDPRVNTSALEAVPSVSCSGDLYFVSTRSYQETFATIYRARFSEGVATGHPTRARHLPPDAILGKRWVNFDAEVSADGQTLYAVDSRSSAAGAPLTADLFIARKRDGAFERTADSDNLRRLVNATELEYAPAVSSDGWSCSSRASTRFAPMPSRASGVPSGAACGSRLPRRNSSAPFQASLKRPLSRRMACRFTTTRA